MAPLRGMLGLFRCQRNKQTPETLMGNGHRFRFRELKEATNNFSRVLGDGGFGNVYEGVLKDGTKVAVKRAKRDSLQGFNEFRTEIQLLSQQRHLNLVLLIGYCYEQKENEMMLVYEYMENGTLRSHLYGTQKPPLSWSLRLGICIEAARGLHYLHTGSQKRIIHRDVKSSNILLGDNLVAKVADFGLSKIGPELDQTHVTTVPKGSFGYLDPQYFDTHHLTDKSDVYSLGVVLLEVACARPAIFCSRDGGPVNDDTPSEERVNLAVWGMEYLRIGELQQIVDQRISGTIRPDSLRKFGKLVKKCLAANAGDRPSMVQVLSKLEDVLRLQDANPATLRFVNPGEASASRNRDLELGPSYDLLEIFTRIQEQHANTTRRNTQSLYGTPHN